jgi:thiosulfate/3-mercaptopyruvate sulfurtransferase
MQLFSTNNRAKFLVGTQELNDLIDAKTPNIRIVNATWYMPNSGKNAWQEHLDQRLTSDTVFFDHDEICDKSVNLPHTLPSTDIFNANMRKLHISKDQNIICYDTQGMFSVARAAWMFRYFGASNVRILDGGLKKWLAEGRPVVNNAP